MTGALYHHMLDICSVGPNTIRTLMASYGKGYKKNQLKCHEQLVSGHKLF